MSPFNFKIVLAAVFFILAISIQVGVAQIAVTSDIIRLFPLVSHLQTISESHTPIYAALHASKYAQCHAFVSQKSFLGHTFTNIEVIEELDVFKVATLIYMDTLYIAFKANSVYTNDDVLVERVIGGSYVVLRSPAASDFGLLEPALLTIIEAQLAANPHVSSITFTGFGSGAGLAHVAAFYVLQKQQQGAFPSSIGMQMLTFNERRVIRKRFCGVFGNLRSSLRLAECGHRSGYYDDCAPGPLYWLNRNSTTTLVLDRQINDLTSEDADAGCLRNCTQNFHSDATALFFETACDAIM